MDEGRSRHPRAAGLALVLKRSGDDAGAARLLALSEAAIARHATAGQSGFEIADVEIHALRGEKREALKALREAERAGWRGPSGAFRDHDANLLHPQRTRIQGNLRRHRARHGRAASASCGAAEGCAARDRRGRHLSDAPTERDWWGSLHRRKIVQWTLAYAAGAWLLVLVVAYFMITLNWRMQVLVAAALGVLIGLPIVLVLAWFRGEHSVSSKALLMVALLFAAGGGAFWFYNPMLVSVRADFAANWHNGGWTCTWTQAPEQERSRRDVLGHRGLPSRLNAFLGAADP